MYYYQSEISKTSATYNQFKVISGNVIVELNLIIRCLVHLVKKKVSYNCILDVKWVSFEEANVKVSQNDRWLFGDTMTVSIRISIWNTVYIVWK